MFENPQRVVMRMIWLVLVVALAACTRYIGTVPEVDQPSSPVPEQPAVSATETPGSNVYFPAVEVAGTLPAEVNSDGVNATPGYHLYAPFVPGPSGGQTTEEVNPQVMMQIAPAELPVGAQMQLTCQISDLGLPIYYLYGRVPGQADAVEIGRIDYTGALTLPQTTFPYLAVVSAAADLQSCNVVLQALAPGSIEIWLNVTGEIHLQDPPGAYWGGASASPAPVVITQ